MIKHLKSPLISCPHEFFTFKRQEPDVKKSSTSFAFSNFDTNSETIANKRLISKSLNQTKTIKILTIKQVHSNRVLVLDESRISDKTQEVDGIVTKIPNIAISILSADCAPILFFEPTKKVIGCAHAGWRGALVGITDNVIKEMVRLGANKSLITAIIGPCISRPNYEVGDDFKETFLEQDTSSKMFFTSKEKNKYTFDLPGYLVNRLKNMGIRNTQWINLCTYSNEHLFHSYRRACHKGEPNYKRNISVISLD